MTTYIRRTDPSPVPTDAGGDAHHIAAYLQALLQQAPSTELPGVALRLARADTSNVPGISVQEALDATGKIVVLGRAGSGKSAMLASVVSAVARRSLDAHFGRPDGDRSLSLEDQCIPLFVELAEADGLHLSDLLHRSFTRMGVRVPSACAERLAEEYPLLVAYDGLDELRADRRLETAAEIASTVARPGSPHRFLLSCREDEFPMYSVWFEECEIRHIEPVTQEQAHEYLTATVQRADCEWRLRDDRVWGFTATVGALNCLRRELTDAKVPAGTTGKLLLGIGRKVLLQVEGRRRTRGGDAVQSRTLVRLLAALAFSMRTEGVAQISRDQACSVITAALGDDVSPEPHLELLLDSGLIEGTDARRCVRFRDTAIDETFSAYALLLHVESGGSLTEYVDTEVDRECWGAPLTLLYGLHPERGAMLRAVMGDGRNPALVRLAVRCLAANEPKEEWGRITAQAELDVSAHLYLGTAFAELGHHDQAVLELGRAVGGGLDNAEVHARLGTLHQTRGDHLAARQEFELALEREPANTAYKRHLGISLALDRQYELATARLREVIADLKGDCALTQHELGGIYTRQGRPIDAKEQLQEAADLIPGSALYRTSLGAVLAASGDLDAAATQLRTALERDPEYAAAHNELGAVLQQQEQLEEALVHYSRAADLRPGEPVYHRNAGAVLRVLCRTSGAERELTTAIELDASYADAYNELGALMLQTDRPAAALENFQRAVELAPAQAQYHLRTGIAYRALKQSAQAIRALEIAASLEATADTHGVLAEAYSENGRLLEALQQYRWAVELSDGLPSYLLNAALVQRRAGMPAEAEASLQRALATDSALADAHYELGALREEQGCIQDALTSYTRASELAPDITRYLVALSRSARKAGDLQRATTVI
ncbi:MAG: tetratricopeptide repeat protein, partial [Chloroflexia bacterium]|nr:tetratricopeptide repeat protein [Chloroflexia bacterium]